jgi:hypothetical protein
MIDMKIKQFFFDREKVSRAIDKAGIGWLKKSALTIRKIARNSMKAGIVMRGRGKNRKQISRSAPAGTPPFYFTRGLKDHLYAGFDFKAKVADIGPVKITTASGTGGEAPKLLEFGGTGKLHRVFGSKPARWAPHPYMAPALAKERPNMPKRWANSVRST